MVTHYNPNTTEHDRKREAFENGMIEYLRLWVITTLIIGLCLLASGQIGKAIDQDFGIYKANHKTAR